MKKKEEEFEAEQKAKRGEAKKTRSGLEKSLKNSMLKKYGETPDSYLKSVLKPEKAENLQRLVDTMDEIGQLDSLRARAGDILRKDIFKGDKKTRKLLEESGLYGKDELDAIEKSVNKIRTVEQRRKSVIADIGNFGSDGPVKDLVETLSAVYIGNKIPGSNLFTVPWARRFLRNKAKNAKTSKEIKALEEFMLNPERYLEVMKEARNAEDIKTSMITALNAAANVSEGDDE